MADKKPAKKEMETKSVNNLLGKGIIAFISGLSVVGLTVLENKYSIPTEKEKFVDIAKKSMHSVLNDIDNMLKSLWEE